MRRTLLALVLVGCSSNPVGNPQDMAMGSDLPMPPGDLAMATGDLQMMTAGTRITSGTGFALQGVTSDDNALFIDGNGDLTAQPIAGGAAMAVAKAVGQVDVRGKVAFVYTAVDKNTGAGDLALWTAAAGTKPMVAAKSVTGADAASSDGAWVLYTANFDGTSALLDVWLAKSDGTMATKLYAGIDGSTAECAPTLLFAGTRAFVTHCTATGDGGALVTIVTAIDTQTGKSVDLLVDAKNFVQPSQDGAKVLLIDSAGTLSVASGAGGPLTKIDSNVAFALLSSDGTRAAYRGSDMTLHASPTTAPQPITLGMGAIQLLGSSPDFSSVLFATKADSKSGLTDVNVASTSKAGSATALVTTTTAALYGDSFSADSSRVLLFTAVDTKNFVGTFQSAPAAGGTLASHGVGAWLTYATAGTRVVFNDNFAKVPLKNGRADIHTVDTAKSDTPALVATQADVDIFISSGKNKIVYTYNHNGAQDGVYVAPLP